MNKKFWLGFYIVSFAIFIIAAVALGFMALLSYDQLIRLDTVIALAASLGILAYLQFVVVSIAYTFLLLGRMWGGIQDGVTTPSVGKAIGFLFIPVFSIYWIFVAWGSYPKEYNSFLDRHRFGAPPITSSVFTIYPVLILLSAIFILPYFILPFVFISLISRVADSVNNLNLDKQAAGQISSVPGRHQYAIPSGSKLPWVFAGVALVFITLVGAVGGALAYRNLNPGTNESDLPKTVGNFSLKGSGSANGSIFGVKNNYYGSYEAGTGKKQEMMYSNYSYLLRSSAVNHMESSSYVCPVAKPSKVATINDANGKPVGKLRTCADGLQMLIGKHFVNLTGSSEYSVKQGTAAPVTENELLEFAKALPLAKGVVFGASTDAPVYKSGDPSTQSSPDTVTTSNPTGLVNTDTPADFSMTAAEFYEQTEGSKRTSGAKKFDKKVVELSGRYYDSGAGDRSVVWLVAVGSDSVMGRTDPAKAGEFASLLNDEKVKIKCLVDGSFQARLTSCVIAERSGVISGSDRPEFTYSAEEFYKLVGDSKLASDTRYNNMQKYRGKLISITGEIMAISGKMHYVKAGESSWVWCEPDPENVEFSSLVAGQEVTLMGIGGLSGNLTHCVVVEK